MDLEPGRSVSGWRQLALHAALVGRRGLRNGGWGWCIALLILLGLPEATVAQTLSLKRSALVLPEPGACPLERGPPTGLTRPSAVTDSLLTAGSRAAILGDHAAAANFLREAAANDPENAVVAYRLARTLDEQGEARAAMLEYCRYLALASAAPDAGEVRDRARELAAAGGAGSVEPWRREGAAGVAAFEVGRFQDALSAFDRVVTLRPEWPDAYYNRAVAHLALANREAAVRDLERYFLLLPDTATDLLTRRELETLRAPSEAVTPAGAVHGEVPPPRLTTAPGSAFIHGLILPGLGQHATGRTPLGLVVLAAAGGAVYYGTRTTTVLRTQGAFDPFGNYYEYEVPYLERPNQVKGFATAAGIALAAALESYVFAARERRALRFTASEQQGTGRVAVRFESGSGEVAVVFRIRTGRL